jgi:hypothetical protein
MLFTGVIWLSLRFSMLVLSCERFPNILEALEFTGKTPAWCCQWLIILGTWLSPKVWRRHSLEKGMIVTLFPFLLFSFGPSYWPSWPNFWFEVKLNT